MIKEKHDKGSDSSVKEDPVNATKESPTTNTSTTTINNTTEVVQIKKEDDVGKKSDTTTTTKNGGLVVGSNNIGSLELKQENPASDEQTSATQQLPGGVGSQQQTSTLSEATSLPLKQEDSIVDTDPLGDAFGLASIPNNNAQSDSVQLGGGNVINKQSMDTQYSQQESQVFVFSTVLANTGAEEVLQGRYPSIIAYHCAQPGTKKFLEKHPLKINQFNRHQHHVQWINTFTLMKNKGCTRSPNLKPPPSIDNFLGPESLEDMVGGLDSDAPWADQKSSSHPLGNLETTNGLPDMGPDMDACSPSLLNMQPKLQGVQVPDENLTPQQRQHREERLASIRKMQQMLFPESQSDGSDLSQQQSAAPSTQGAPPGGMGAPVVAAQMEWQKLQTQFFDTKKPQQPSSQGNNPNCNVPVGPASVNGPQPPNQQQQQRSGGGGGPRLQGPPPPYHQTQRSASVPIALQSPNPTSPNNPTSNLSLPSPRASSALNSPADPSNRQFGGGLQRTMSQTGQSPTSQDSPSASRMNHSNPSTPLSSHLSPSVTCTGNAETSTHSNQVDGMFGRTLQSIAQQKQHLNTSTTTSCSTMSTSNSAAGKEPNLMPVPSPQQIQYLNTFEGQELIIQKQPNTSLKDGNILSPPVLPSNLDNPFPGSTPDLPQHSRVSGPNTPTSMEARYPPTPGGVPPDGCRFQISSPHTPNASSCGEKPSRMSNAVTPGMSPHQTLPGPTSDPLKNDLFFGGPNASPGSQQSKLGPNFNVSPQGKPLDLPGFNCASGGGGGGAGGRNENIPLNPNCTSSMVGNPKQTHFDPISSLAQMSQQLTNSVASNLNGQPGQGPHMMGFGSQSMHMIDMGACHGGMGDMSEAAAMMGMNPMQGPPHGFHPGSPMGHMRSHSPKLPGNFPNHMPPMQRMMGRAPGPVPGPSPFNGANVQVKPNAPNTIQYLPAKGQGGAPPPGPRGPPSLDFLTRLASPMMDTSKMQPGSGQYFPGCGPPMQGSPMGGHMGHMEPGMGQEPPPMMGGPMGGGPHMGNGTGSPMMGGGGGGPGPMGMGPGGPGGPGMIPMMRAGMRPMMRMPPQMGFGGPGPDNSGMFPGAAGSPLGPGNPQMFVAGPKSSPMGMAPDASQPLPPSMGQSGGFKGAPFVGPLTSDPNYAQQYHNFQQQLYATNTRSQMGGVGQNMGPGPGPQHMQHLP